MSEMFGDIMGMRNVARVEHEELQSQRMQASLDESARRRKEAEDRAYHERESLRIGRDFAGLLEQHGIPSMQVYEDDEGPVEAGRGWHALTMPKYQGADMPPSLVDYVLLDSGRVATSHMWRIVSDGSGGIVKGKVLEGICYPSTLSSLNALKLLMSEDMQRGIASLIEVGKPYASRRVGDGYGHF